MFPSGNRMKSMLILLLWMGLFFDLLDSFTPTVRVIETTGMTITLPPATADEDFATPDVYPSSLHHIHIRALLTPEESFKCCEISKAYAEETGCWETPDYERHQSYATCDFPVDDCRSLEDYLKELDFDNRLWTQLSELYDVDPEDMDYIDLFVAHYQAKEKEEDDKANDVMDSLELHRDGSLLSFSLLLNPPEEFTGGGTLYDALRDAEPEGILHAGGVIRPLKAGEACLHCGKILHGADKVTSGSRTVLVGFIEVADRCWRPGALTEACKNFGRMDVASFRNKRQLKMGNRGWKLNNGKWLMGASAFKNAFVPAFQSTARRADSGYQRQRKLEAEDIMLRNILLPPDERPEDVFTSEEITILDFEEDVIEPVLES